MEVYSSSNMTSTPYHNLTTSSQWNEDIEPILVPIAVPVVCINCVVIILFCRSHALRRNSSNFLLLSLAISDLMTGAVNIPLFVGCFRSRSQHVCLLVYGFHHFTATLTCYHILAITVDRFCAVCRPLQRRGKHLKPIFCKVIFGLWTCSGVVAFSAFAVKPATDADIIYGMLYLVVVFVLPYMFIVWAYAVILRTIRQRKKRFSFNNNKGMRSSYSAKTASDLKCILVFATMATLFAVCWAPWYVTTALLKFSINIVHLYKPFAYIRYATSILNPILYSLFKADFLAELKSLLGAKASHRRNSSVKSLISKHVRTSSARSRDPTSADNGRGDDPPKRGGVEEENVFMHEFVSGP